jgi:hypothetical protein
VSEWRGRGSSVVTLTEGQEQHIRIWPEPGEELTVLMATNRWLGFAVVIRGRALSRAVCRVRRLRSGVPALVRLRRQ